MMVAAGFGVCFLPEFSPTIPGVRTQLVTDPEVVREISLVSMFGRRFSPAVLTFTPAIRSHDWAKCDLAKAPLFCGQAAAIDLETRTRRNVNP